MESGPAGEASAVDLPLRRDDGAAGTAELAEQPDVLRAALLVHRQIELPEILRALTEACAGWSGAESAFGIGPGENPRRLAALAATVRTGDPRLHAFLPLDPVRVRRTIGESPVVFDGLGPVEGLVGAWPEPPPRATAALPLTDAAGRWHGLVLLLFDRPPAGGSLERPLALLSRSGPAVGHALQMLALRELVIKDDTAQCFNRRYFEEFLPEELARASRFRAPLSLIFLDMDNLKEVNNRHGHAMGSRTLNEVSTRIRRRVRKFDKLFRFGGDEFCIVLPETEWHGAVEVAERVRDAITAKPFLVAEVGGGGTPMTASLGVAAFPLHARTPEALVRLADRAMQQVKRGSKNAVRVAEVERDGDEP